MCKFLCLPTERSFNVSVNFPQQDLRTPRIGEQTEAVAAAAAEPITLPEPPARKEKGQKRQDVAQQTQSSTEEGAGGQLGQDLQSGYANLVTRAVRSLTETSNNVALDALPSLILPIAAPMKSGMDLSMSESGSLEGGGWVIGLWASHRGVPCVPASVPEDWKKLDLDFIV